MKQNEIRQGENCRPQQNINQASQPGVRAESFQKSQNTSKVPSRELYEEFIPEDVLLNLERTWCWLKKIYSAYPRTGEKSTTSALSLLAKKLVTPTSTSPR